MSTPTTVEVRKAIAAFTVMPPNTRAVTPKQFDAWLVEHDAQKRAEWEAEQGEVEWEYGIHSGNYGVLSVGAPWMDRQFAAKVTANDSGNYGVRRRKAGPWILVNEEGKNS